MHFYWTIASFFDHFVLTWPLGINFLSSWWSSLLSKHNTKSPSLSYHSHPLRVFASSRAFYLFCLISTKCRDCRCVSSSLSNCIIRAFIFSFADNRCSEVILKVDNSISRGSTASVPYTSSNGVWPLPSYGLYCMPILLRSLFDPTMCDDLQPSSQWICIRCH